MIKVYSSPTCTRCAILKKVLLDNNIDFQEINIYSDLTSVSYLNSKGVELLPGLEIDGQFVDPMEYINKIKEAKNAKQT